MKICFYTESVFSFGGVQRVLAVVAGALSEYHDVTVLTLDNPADENLSMYGLDKTSVKFLYLNYKKPYFYEWLPCKAYSFLYKKLLPQNKTFSRWYGYSSFPHSQRKQLIDTINKNEFDVVIGVHAFLSFHLASVKKRIKAKVLGWMHNSYEAFFDISGAYLKGQRNHFSYEMKCLDKVIVLTEHDKNLYKEKLNLDAAVIYNPLTLMPEGKGSPNNKKFLSVGRLSYRHKGFDILIKAFRLFAKQNEDWILDIVGDGPDKKFLQDMIDSYNLGGRIKIHPFTGNVQKYYSSASVYILSSRWEGSPLVLLESMAHFLPVISSSIPVAVELLGNCDGTVFFESENALSLAEKMLEMAESGALTDMGEKSYLYTSKFNIGGIEKDWENILME